MKDHLQIGTITSSHGLKGEMSIFPTTDDPHRFEDLKVMLVSRYKVSDESFDEKLLERYDISSVRINGRKVLIQAAGINTRDDSDKLKGRFIVVRRDDAVLLDEDVFFIADIIGCKVYDNKLGELGILTEVLETGSNDVYIIEGGKLGQILIPVLKDVVIDIKPEDGIITVVLPEGLLDD